jgi:hypothetical protein
MTHEFLKMEGKLEAISSFFYKHLIDKTQADEVTSLN